MTPQPITGTGDRRTRRYWIGSNRLYDRYNRSLVDCIADLIDPSSFMDWKTLLYENNRGKRGLLFKTPNAFITFLAKLRALYSIPFGFLAIAKIFSRITDIRSICYTNIFRRIRKIHPALFSPDSVNSVESAIDSTGFNITIRGDYLRDKWNRNRKG